MLLGSLGVVAARYEKLRSDNRFDSLLSRESAFLLNNVLFVAAALTVLWGTIYPIVAEATSGVRLTVGPPFFNSVFIPVGLAIVGLTGIGPLISWRRMSSGSLTRIVRVPLLAGAVTATALAVAGVRSTGALLAFSLCTFTAVAIGSEFVRGSSVYRGPGGLSWPAALLKTLLRNRRRYGGYVVHLGVILIVIGLSGSAFSSERQELLAIGESTTIGDYTLTYTGFDQEETDEKQILEATIVVSRGNEPIATLRPQRNFHFAQEQPQSEVAIRTTPVEDLYIVITSFDQDGTAAVRAFVNPLTWWIWAGAFVMLAGMGVLLSSEKPVEVGVPSRKRAPEKVAVTQ